MKEGTEVKITDGSYSMKIDDYKVVFAGGLRNETWIVLALGCTLPACRKEQMNNVIIKGKKTGQVVFIQKRFCCPIDDDMVVINGKRWSKDTIAEALRHHAK